MTGPAISVDLKKGQADMSKTSWIRRSGLGFAFLAGFAGPAGAGTLDGFLLVRLLSLDAQALRRALVTLFGHLIGRALPRTWSI